MTLLLLKCCYGLEKVLQFLTIFLLLDIYAPSNGIANTRCYYARSRLIGGLNAHQRRVREDGLGGLLAEHNWWFETSLLLGFVRFLNFGGSFGSVTRPLIGLVTGALLKSGIL